MSITWNSTATRHLVHRGHVSRTLDQVKPACRLSECPDALSFRSRLQRDSDPATPPEFTVRSSIHTHSGCSNTIHSSPQWQSDFLLVVCCASPIFISVSRQDGSACTFCLVSCPAQRSSTRQNKDVIAVSPHGLFGLQDAPNSPVSSGDYRGTDDRGRHRDCEYLPFQPTTCFLQTCARCRWQPGLSAYFPLLVC
jgi:hypothetical protein